MCVLTLFFCFFVFFFFIYVVMFILSIVFWVSSILVLVFRCFNVEFLFTVSCSCVVLVLLLGT